MSIPDSTFSKTLHFLTIFLVKKVVRVISPLYRRSVPWLAVITSYGGKIQTAFIRCLVIYVKPCPIISQTIGRSAVIQEERSYRLTDLPTYLLFG